MTTPGNRLARIEERCDHILTILTEDHAARDKHEARISSLERWRSWLFGLAAAVTASFSYLFSKTTP